MADNAACSGGAGETKDGEEPRWWWCASDLHHTNRSVVRQLWRSNTAGYKPVANGWGWEPLHNYPDDGADGATG